MDRKAFEIDGISVSYLVGGSGFPILMIHGSGPGASTVGNWNKVLPPLVESYQVFAMDLVGFGDSGRKPAQPYFDFPLWLRQCEKMLQNMPGDRIGVIGHSVSGSLALKLAAAQPRVAKVMTTGCMGAIFTLNDLTESTWTFPRNREQ